MSGAAACRGARRDGAQTGGCGLRPCAHLAELDGAQLHIPPCANARGEGGEAHVAHERAAAQAAAKGGVAGRGAAGVARGALLGGAGSQGVGSGHGCCCRQQLRRGQPVAANLCARGAPVRRAAGVCNVHVRDARDVGEQLSARCVQQARGRRGKKIAQDQQDLCAAQQHWSE